MKTKILRITLALVLIIAAIAPVTAFASPNYTFSFTFKDYNNHFLAEHEKGDDGQTWVITLYNNGTNNMSSSNIFGAKMNCTEKDAVDVYHTFSNYVSHYTITYRKTVCSSDVMYLGIKKDRDSTSSGNLIISGIYNP